ncbi:MAG: hypothetical protein WCO06_05945 [Candidatus Roizmanbacteria bacterium]
MRYITLCKMFETTTFHFYNGKKLTLYTDPTKVRHQIQTLFPGDEKGSDDFMRLSGEMYQLLYHGPKLARRNYHKLLGFDFLFSKHLFEYVSKLHIYESWKQIVDRLFKHEEL